jgi:thiamine biosynthesis lipoprotein
VHRFVFDAIGTAWGIDLFDPLPRLMTIDVEARITRRIAAYDADYSRFRDDSLVARMAKITGDYRLPDDARPLFDLYRDLYKVTQGAMTPLIGQALCDAGYDAQYSLQPKPLTSPPDWDDVLAYDYPMLRVKKPVLLDVGAAGKGYLVDIVGDVLEKAGTRHYCIDAGGDIVYRGPVSQPMSIGLEHPDELGQIIGVATVANQSLCGSAGNRRAWSGYHHIIDPRSLASPRHLRAVWVVAGTALLADALTTALFFVPAKILANRYTFEYAMVHDNFALERSAGFPAQFFYR